MPSRLEVYKCAHCGNIVEVLHGGGAPLICCGEPMKQLREGQTDGALEKHVPVIEKTENGYRVKVGSVGLGPRGDWAMPSDASGRVWLSEIEAL